MGCAGNSVAISAEAVAQSLDRRSSDRSSPKSSRKYAPTSRLANSRWRKWTASTISRLHAEWVTREPTRSKPCGRNQLPYGVGASLAHVVGSDQGGGFEWHAAPSVAPLQRGNTAIELDDHAGITRFTTIYDSYQFSDAQYQSLVLLGAEQ